MNINCIFDFRTVNEFSGILLAKFKIDWLFLDPNASLRINYLFTLFHPFNDAFVSSAYPNWFSRECLWMKHPIMEGIPNIYNDYRFGPLIKKRDSLIFSLKFLINDFAWFTVWFWLWKKKFFDPPSNCFRFSTYKNVDEI